MFRGVQVTNAHTALSVVSRTGWGNVGNVGESVPDLLLRMGNGIEAVLIRGIDDGLDWRVVQG